MSQLFSKIKVANSSRSTFDLSHHQVTTSDFGYLIPICYRDMLPNDDFVVKPDIYCRLAPLAMPVYGKITCSIFHFFVPYRVLYPKWDSFITQDASNNTVPPYITFSNLYNVAMNDPAINLDDAPGDEVSRGLYQRLLSNLGFNPNFLNVNHNLNDERFAAFPLLAYQRIWMDYFMDSNINSHSSMIESFNQQIANGGSLSQSFVADILQCRNACFKKDYFTTAKLSPQSGNPATVGVDIASASLNPGLWNTSETVSNMQKKGNAAQVGITSGRTSKIGQFTAEVMRYASALQRYSERSNFVGSKLINQLLVHFGVAPTAERLDMAEFLGGDSFPIQIGDVTSTSQQSTGSSLDSFGLGAQAGKGIGACSGNSVRYHAKEHGVFMSLMTIRPDTGYYQGISRFWTKGVTGDAFDYFTPEFENLGYQEVLNKEVFVPQNVEEDYQDWNPDGIFGYQPRYSEYKFQNDVLGSDFVAVDTADPFSQSQSTAIGSPMDSFHLFRHLSYNDSSPLALNNNFVECNNQANDYDRIFQITDNKLDHFYFNIDVDVKATRDMVDFAEPSIDAVQNLGDGNKIEIPYGGTRL